MGCGGVQTPTNSPRIDNKISKKKIMLSKNKKAASVKYNTNTLTNFTTDYKQGGDIQA